MTQHRQSKAAMALMTVAAFIVTILASSAAPAEPPTMKELSETGPYHVIRSQANRSEHEGALIAVVKTQRGANGNPPVHDLIFVETTGETRGEGIICRPSRPNPNASFHSCDQQIAGVKETLIIGAIGSPFCNELWLQIENCVERHPQFKKDLYTSKKENPVMKEQDCESGPCVCFEIKKNGGSVCPVPGGPPGSGTGSGGHD